MTRSGRVLRFDFYQGTDEIPFCLSLISAVGVASGSTMSGFLREDFAVCPRSWLTRITSRLERGFAFTAVLGIALLTLIQEHDVDFSLWKACQPRAKGLARAHTISTSRLTNLYNLL